ncbi:hypothetical protein [Alkalitalea saponilacus]|uniref:Nuclear transport factor 2 family protein n=1 Tax=Alkalitalea saponilacus TaxID=889453 RepID=A0A1T5DXX1_9BACT|nr:hypothetical protein [Alkalitalea saponilacus]ASB49155.1 hypothetical protein CDL62_08370 [Alkalitalea saponilacus]SKB76409.1 hypothetical protein SAMN03080601_01158 [Alkalitalea saponilacus]
MKKTIYIFLILAMIIPVSTLYGQNLNLNKTPKKEHLAAAKELAKKIFDNLANKNHQEIANFIVDNIGFNWDESRRISSRNDYLSKLEILSLKPPMGVFGDLFGYDLIEEAFLMGSDRYFRHTYLSYHEGSLLIWEFRFYVNKDGNTTLHYIGWSDNNPFEYMSTPDMVLPRYN